MILAVVLALAIGFGAIKIGKKRMAGGIILALMIAVVAGLFNWNVISMSDIKPASFGTGANQNMVDFGSSATVTLNAYDLEADGETEVYPEYYVLDSEGNKLVNGAHANTTSTTVGQVISIDGSSEDATYYVDSVESFSVITTAPTVSIDAHTIVTETNLAISGYDDTMTGLTADDATNNTNDYNLGNYGADESNNLIVKFRNGQTNSLHQLGAICVGWGGDVDSFKLTEAGWHEDSRGIPKELDDATVASRNDANTSSTVQWKTCYVPYAESFSTSAIADRVVKFTAYADQFFDFQLVAGSTAPTANTGDVVIVGFFDIAYEKGKDGSIYFDYFVHDDNEEVTDIGLSEDSVTNAYGLDTVVAFELQ